LTLIRGSLGICPCLLDAYPSIESVSWYRNGKSVRIAPRGNLHNKKKHLIVYFLSGGAYTINSDYSLVIKSVETDDDGEYICRAQNSQGFGRDSISFYVETRGLITVFIN
jgi:hypothetical protein